MKSNHASDIPREQYLVQMDGIAAADHLGFVEALKVGLKLRQQYPQSSVKIVEEASNQAADAVH